MKTHATELENAFRARLPDRDPSHKATIFRNEVTTAAWLCFRRAVNFVSSEMEGMSKDMALDKYNSRRNCNILDCQYKLTIQLWFTHSGLQ